MNKEELKEKVFQSLGQASMCWSETPKGVFESDRAVQIGDELMTYIIEFANPSYLVKTINEMTRDDFAVNQKNKP